MGDFADDGYAQEDARARRARPALELLEDTCERGECMGIKTVSYDGRTVTCECGMGCKNKVEW